LIDSPARALKSQRPEQAIDGHGAVGS
jgi:hypothetical protein